ncbi:MAG: hypothetical protein OFPI_27260 [Osedax symbiont Rs2]|nr:MAG: hypothetical protein OFPI_27260 [Osedax symbiont Rs2]
MNSSSTNRFDFFDLKFIFIFLSIYFVLIPFLFDINLDSVITVCVVFSGIFFFLLGYTSNKKLSLPGHYDSVPITLSFQTIGCAFLFWDFLSGVNNLWSVINAGNYTASYRVLNFNAIYIQIPLLALSYLKYYCYAMIMARNKLVYFVVFVIQVSLFYNSPARLVALSPFFIFIVYGYYMGYLKVTYVRLFIILLFSPFLMVILLVSRRPTNGEHYFQIILNTIHDLDLQSFSDILSTALESFQSFNTLTKIVIDSFIHLESGILRIIFMPISRSIWEDKPESISRVISKEYIPDQYENGGGSVATVFGDAFINGHVFGVVFLLFFLGLFSKILYNSIKDRFNLVREKQSFVCILYSLYFYQFLFILRGFFSESIWKILLLFLVFFLLHKIQFYGSTRKKKA